MRIGINASWMMPGAAGGLEWYCRNIIDQLAILDEHNDYVLVTAPNNLLTFNTPGRNWKLVVYGGGESAPASYIRRQPSRPPAAHRWLLQLRELAHRRRATPYWTGRLCDLIGAESLDVWFCPLIYALPLDANVPIVACVPDLQHEHCPEFFGDAQRAERALAYQHTCRTAAAVIAISDFTGRDIVDRYGVDPQRVFVTPLGVDRSFERLSDVERRIAHARTKYGLADGYIYYPAAAWAHKNHENLVRAFAIARTQGFAGRLVLTGWPFDLPQRLAPLLRALNVEDHVVHLGYIDRDDVVGILAGARALVFPSLFEGFGLPVLEAMHMGVPVACSGFGSLPEVGGDAVELFDPHSPASIADAILRITSNNSLRHTLIARGKTQAAKFDYRHAAETTLKVFEAVGTGALASPDVAPFRPLASHNWLMEGHGRWYFHSDDLECVHLELDQPTSHPELADQRVETILDEQDAVEGPVPSGVARRITVRSNGPVRGGFHCLEVRASRQATVNGATVSVRVTGIRLQDRRGGTTKLL